MVIKKQYEIDNLPDYKLRKGDGGLYAIMPFERLDEDGNAVFKVGQAFDFRKRFEGYHTYFPLGFYYKNLLAEPNKERDKYYYRDADDRNKRKLGKRAYYNNIERFIIDDILDHGGQQIYTTTRVKRPKFVNGILVGETEWFYTNPKTIDTAFRDASKVYGGKLYSAHLGNINANASKYRSRGRTYDGEIHFKVFS